MRKDEQIVCGWCRQPWWSAQLWPYTFSVGGPQQPIVLQHPCQAAEATWCQLHIKHRHKEMKGKLIIIPWLKIVVVLKLIIKKNCK
jgi:hypothetical protein